MGVNVMRSTLIRLGFLVLLATTSFPITAIAANDVVTVRLPNTAVDVVFRSFTDVNDPDGCDILVELTQRTQTLSKQIIHEELVRMLPRFSIFIKDGVTISSYSLAPMGTESGYGQADLVCRKGKLYNKGDDPGN